MKSNIAYVLFVTVIVGIPGPLYGQGRGRKLGLLKQAARNGISNAEGRAQPDAPSWFQAFQRQREENLRLMGIVITTTTPKPTPDPRILAQQLAEQRRTQQELAEQRRREQQLAEQKIKEQELAEQRLREQQLAEQKLREQKELAEQKLREQQLAEQKLRERQELVEQKLRELQLAEQRFREQQEHAEQKLREKQLLEQKLRDEQIAEQERLRAEQLLLQQQNGQTTDPGNQRTPWDPSSGIPIGGVDVGATLRPPSVNNPDVVPASPLDGGVNLPTGGSIFGPSGDLSGSSGTQDTTNTNQGQPIVPGEPLGPNGGVPLGPFAPAEPLGPNAGKPLGPFAPGEPIGGGQPLQWFDPSLGSGQEAQFREVDLNQILGSGPSANTGSGTGAGIKTVSGELIPRTVNQPTGNASPTSTVISKSPSSTILRFLSGLQTKLKPK